MSTADGAARSVVILLDVDGVLDPDWRRTADGPTATIDPDVVATVHALAELGELVWATTTAPAQFAALDAALGRTDHLRAVSMVDLEPGARTPKLAPVRRWVDREHARGAAADLVVWIDDRLGPDAHAWADGTTGPAVVLVPVDPRVGLTAAVLDVVRDHLGTAGAG